MLQKSTLQFFKFSAKDAPAIFLLVITLVLLLKGYPLPHRDDLLFIGSPINYCQTGHFDNPFCSGFTAQFHTIKHFAYMPLQAFLLAGWMKILGVSTASLLSFQWLFYFIGMASLYFLSVQKFLLKRNAALLVCTAYLVIIVQMGLRPDACGFGFVLVGLCLLDAKNTWGKFIGFTLCGFGFIASPLAFGLFLPIALFLFIQDKSSKFLSYFIASLAGATISISLLGIIINFEFVEFYRVFNEHVKIKGDELSSLFFFFQLITDKYELVLKFPLYLFSVLIGAFVVFKNRGLEQKITITLIGCILFSALLYTEKTAYFSGLIMCWIILAVGFTTFPNRFSQHIYLTICILLFGISQSAFFIPLILQKSGIVLSKISVEMKTKKYKTIVADTEATRYIYDYKLPPNFLALNYYEAGFYPTSFADCKIDEIWLYSPGFAYFYGEDIPDKTIGNVSILGKELRSVPVHPHQILMYHH